MSCGQAPRSRRLTRSEVRERLQAFDRKLAQRALYPHEEAELEGLLNGTYRRPVQVPEPRRVTPFRRAISR
jgi:hypothetical protein